MAQQPARGKGSRGKLTGAARYIASGQAAEVAGRRKKFEDGLDGSLTEVEKDEYREQYAEAEAGELYVVDPDCWQSVIIYMRLHNQWERSGMDGVPTALPIERIERLMDVCYRAFSDDERCRTMDDLLTMADAAIVVFGEIKAAGAKRRDTDSGMPN